MPGIKEIPDPPDRLQLTRIHYICTSSKCLADVYRDTRQVTVKCNICGTSWCPNGYQPGSWAYGQEEVNTRPARYDRPRCAKHGLPDCKECLKAELYSE